MQHSGCTAKTTQTLVCTITQSRGWVCSFSAAATSACWDSASHPQVCSFCLGSHLGSPPRPVLAQVAMVSTSQDTGTMFCSPMAPTRNTRMALVSLYLSGTSARTLLPSCLLALTVVCCSSRDIVVRHVLCDNNWRQGLSIISVINMTVHDSVFRNTSGTLPMFGTTPCIYIIDLSHTCFSSLPCAPNYRSTVAIFTVDTNGDDSFKGRERSIVQPQV